MPRVRKNSEDLSERLPDEVDSYTPADRPNEAAVDGEPTRPPTKKEQRDERWAGK